MANSKHIPHIESRPAKINFDDAGTRFARATAILLRIAERTDGRDLVNIEDA